MPWVIRRIHRSSRNEIQRVPRRHQVGAHNPIAVDAGTGGRRQVLSRMNSSSGESAVPPPAITRSASRRAATDRHGEGLICGQRATGAPLVTTNARQLRLARSPTTTPGHSKRRQPIPPRRNTTQASDACPDAVYPQDHRWGDPIGRLAGHLFDDVGGQDGRVGRIRSVAPRAVHRPARRRRRSSAPNDGADKCEKITGRIRVRTGTYSASGGGRSVDAPQWEAGCRPSRGLRPARIGRDRGVASWVWTGGMVFRRLQSSW